MASVTTGRLSRGDTILKVDHAGEHGAVCIYSAQRWLARWRAPAMIDELDHFLGDERCHRATFAAELALRGRARCRSYHLCALGGLVLGTVTGLLGARAIATTTVAIERVVLQHMEEQIAELAASDPAACRIVQAIVGEEREHHELSALRLGAPSWMQRVIDGVVARSTEAVIWLGMRL